MKRAANFFQLILQLTYSWKARPCAREDGSTVRRAAAKRIQTFVILTAALALAGCGAQPQILTFNYAVKPDASIISSVQSGQTTASSLLGQNPCNFTADFSAWEKPKIMIGGNPGQTGFNVYITTLGGQIRSITTTNPPNCTAIQDLEIAIGDQSLALALGVQTNKLNGRIVLADGQQFRTSDFFQARVNYFEPSNRRSSGDFRFINRLSAGSNTVLIVEGSYALTP